MKSEGSLKIFFVKLISITFAIIVVLNVFYNIFLADKLKFINDLSKMEKSTAEMIKNKIRSELRSGLEKDKILTDEDAKLIKQFLNKISSELRAR